MITGSPGVSTWPDRGEGHRIGIDPQFGLRRLWFHLDWIGKRFCHVLGDARAQSSEDPGGDGQRRGHFPFQGGHGESFRKGGGGRSHPADEELNRARGRPGRGVRRNPQRRRNGLHAWGHATRFEPLRKKVLRVLDPRGYRPHALPQLGRGLVLRLRFEKTQHDRVPQPPRQPGQFFTQIFQVLIGLLICGIVRPKLSFDRNPPPAGLAKLPGNPSGHADQPAAERTHVR